MRRMIPALVGLALFGAALLAGCQHLPWHKSTASEEVKATPEMIKVGRQAFRENCAKCHGRKEAGPAPNLMKVKSLPASKVRSMVRKGHEDEMPAFSTAEISDEQLTAIIGFLQDARAKTAAREAKGNKPDAPKTKKAHPTKTKTTKPDQAS